MILSELEVAMEHLWAKSSPDPNMPGPTLFRHSLDVVGQMARCYDLYRPRWPMLKDAICLPRVLAYSALAHDFGKIHTHFQDVLQRRRPKFGNRHEILSLVFLDWLNIPATERPWVDAAVSLHHKNLCALIAANQPFYVGDQFGSPGTSVRHLADGINPQNAGLLYELLRHAEEVFRVGGWLPFDYYELRPHTPLNYVESIRAALIRVQGLATSFEAQIDDFGNVREVPWAARRAGIQIRGLMLLA